jgi:FtsP/CotA-like multicopper oxidase with cupredoxin domain
MPLSERLMWGRMRMDPTDIADVTGETYTYLVNGHGRRDWTGLLRPGERVRLRIINAAAQSIFNSGIPGLAMTVVRRTGNMSPVIGRRVQIGMPNYDVMSRPTETALIRSSRKASTAPQWPGIPWRAPASDGRAASRRSARP